eukprot:7089743-Pyramimonas_sp.AAC.2
MNLVMALNRHKCPSVYQRCADDWHLFFILSMKDFQFCSVCRCNNTEGRQHRYKKRHQEALQTVINKVLKKVQDARFFLRHPRRLTGDSEREQNSFWCNFCECKVEETKSTWARYLTLCASWSRVRSTF